MAKGRKRLIEDVGDEDIRRSGGKRSRSDGAATESNNSDTSHISALTTIFSPRSSHSVTPETETGSDSELSESSEEPSSPSSSSSDEDEDESEADRQEDVTVVRVGAKPEIQPAARLGAGLLQRLRSFMPEMEKANEQLQRERVDGTLGERSLEVDAEGQGAYIEMVGFCLLKASLCETLTFE